MENSILFQNLNIELDNVGKSISIFGFSIAYYGIVIAIGMVLAGIVILRACKLNGESEDDYLDFIIWGILIGVIGARAYYVVFQWDLYKDDLLSIFNLRQGGLAIYGGIIFGTIAVYAVCKKKKLSFRKVADTAILGVPLAQAIGRWGNFFNREVFGGYTDSLLAMQLPINSIRSMDDVTDEMLEHIQVIDGVEFISVHPTFLYESMWNLCLFVILVLLHRHFRKTTKPFDGVIFLVYLFGYGLGRFWIEQVRTDQLYITGTQIPVSMVIALICVIASVVLFIIGMRKKQR